MRDDLPPFARIGMEFFATIFRWGGAIVSCLSLFGTFSLGFNSLFHPEPPRWQIILTIAGIFLGTHALGLLCHEFGKVMGRNRLPVPPQKMGAWLLFRFLLFWLLAALVPLFLLAGKLLYLCDLAVVPASLVAIACLKAIVFFHHKIGHLERPILPGQIEPDTASPEGGIPPDHDP